MVTERAPRRGREALAAAICHGVLDELDDVGYAGVTFEGVARRIHTSKPVLYRRFRSRAHMVFEALAAQTDTESLARTRGTLRENLIDTLLAVRQRFLTIGLPTYRGLLAEADDELFRAVASLGQTRGETVVRQVVSVARQRGDIGQGEIPAAVLRLPPKILRDHLLFGDSDDSVVAEIADEICLPLIYRAADS
jgi:AcrR family transcriptional regulator